MKEFDWKNALKCKNDAELLAYCRSVTHFKKDYVAIVDCYEDEPLYILKKLSANWVTCACGQTCKDLPKLDDCDEPQDFILSNLGHEFNNQLKTNHPHESYDFSAPISILDKIESRTKKLLCQV